jgi:HPt (histidine-containing phosphotransfer) domain-containing protein
MDFQMPEWDGLTATRALRAYELQQNLPRLPVIALTANAMTGFEETCRQAGMDGFLSKPMREQDLAATLKQWLPRYQQSRDITADKTSSEPSAPLQAAHPAKRAFNREKIYKLCRNEPAQVIEMLELFISSTQPILVALRTAISNEDTAQASRQAHQIKGAAAYLGADLMTQHAADAERFGKLGQFDACAKSTDQLEAAFNTVCDDIRLDIQASSPFR